MSEPAAGAAEARDRLPVAAGLQEQLARRLAKMAESLPYLDEFDVEMCQGRPENHPGWFALADECLRQIKWTWMSAKWANPESMSWDTEVLEDGEPKLTLAPDDWQP